MSSSRPIPPTREAESGWLYLLAAAVLGVVGGIAFVSGSDVGALIGTIVLGVGSLAATIGTVAIGVTVGVRRAHEIDR